MDIIYKFIFALRFFTRLPIPGKNHSDANLSDAALTFPIAGAAIGTILAFVWWCAYQWLPGLPAAGLTIGAGLLLTGALHEDGLSDCVDGLGGGHTKERALEIMRDSRIGAYGAAALIISIALRWTCLASLSLWTGVITLIIAHMIARSSMTIAISFSSYARKEGLGKSVSDGISPQTFIIITIITALLTFLLGSMAGAMAAAIAFIMAWLVSKWLDHRLGGYTGDGLGAMEQIAEIAVMLVLVGFWASA